MSDHIDLSDAAESWERSNALMCQIRADRPELYRWLQARPDPFAELSLLIESMNEYRTDNG